MLVALIALTKPCANAVSTFVMGFDGSAAKGSATPIGSAAKPSGTVDVPKPSANPEDYEHLDPNMTEDQLRAAVARSKAKLGSAATGSAAPQTGSAGSGSAGPIPRAPAPRIVPGSAIMQRGPGSGPQPTGSATAGSAAAH